MDSQFEGSKATSIYIYIYIYIIPKGNMEATFLVRVLRLKIKDKTIQKFKVAYYTEFCFNKTN
jgi:hypothetical protein